MMDKEVFAARLKESREKKNITIKELAEKCNVSVSAMNRYVTASSSPTLEVASIMAQVLDISLDWLCGLKGEEILPAFTTGSVIRILSGLLTMPTVERENNAEYAAVFGEYRGGSPYVNVDQSRIPECLDFASWKKFLELLKSGTIDEDMYSAWIEKKAKELDSVKLPVMPASQFTAVDTDELPF